MKLALAGDVMLGRLVNRALCRLPPEHLWGDALPLLRGADAAICNLECALSDGGERAHKEFAFRSDAKNVAVLRGAGIDAVSLANNHILDYGPEALQETLDTLDRAGVAHAGAGASLAEARAPALLRRAGATLAMLSVTDNEPAWEAGPDRPGIWHVPVVRNDPRAVSLLAAVAATRAMADLLVVAFHWGTNWGYRPEPGHREFAHALIGAGADLVFGHSCHVARGIEIDRGGVILYGAGDLIDDYAVDEFEPNDESWVFVVETSGGRTMELRAHPLLIRRFRPLHAGGARREVMLERMTSRCRELGTTSEWDEAEGALRIAIGGARGGSRQGEALSAG
ncbi:MAG: CapA family protein [Candidatus Eisenbacteria bacterium]